jgi:hyperosmotically inducible periplasmic protein
MRVFWLFVAGTVLAAGCANREDTARRDIIPAPSVPAPSTPATPGPSTTADQATPGGSGSYSNQGRVEMRQERRSAKPVIDDDTIEPDNTRVNRRDADTTLTKTPRDQGQSEGDIETTAAIRKRVVDMDLSTSAENVKIITAEGNVILRGVVKSDEEKQKIERIARELAGEGKVESQLMVDVD